MTSPRENRTNEQGDHVLVKPLERLRRGVDSEMQSMTNQRNDLKKVMKLWKSKSSTDRKKNNRGDASFVKRVKSIPQRPRPVAVSPSPSPPKRRATVLSPSLSRQKPTARTFANYDNFAAFEQNRGNATGGESREGSKTPKTSNRCQSPDSSCSDLSSCSSSTSLTFTKSYTKSDGSLGLVPKVYSENDLASLLSEANLRDKVDQEKTFRTRHKTILSRRVSSDDLKRPSKDNQQSNADSRKRYGLRTPTSFTREEYLKGGLSRNTDTIASMKESLQAKITKESMRTNIKTTPKTFANKTPSKPLNPGKLKLPSKEDLRKMKDPLHNSLKKVTFKASSINQSLIEAQTKSSSFCRQTIDHAKEAPSAIRRQTITHVREAQRTISPLRRQTITQLKRAEKSCSAMQRQTIEHVKETDKNISALRRQTIKQGKNRIVRSQASFNALLKAPLSRESSGNAKFDTFLPSYAPSKHGLIFPPVKSKPKTARSFSLYV